MRFDLNHKPTHLKHRVIAKLAPTATRIHVGRARGSGWRCHSRGLGGAGIAVGTCRFKLSQALSCACLELPCIAWVQVSLHSLCSILGLDGDGVGEYDCAVDCTVDCSTIAVDIRAIDTINGAVTVYIGAVDWFAAGCLVGGGGLMRGVWQPALALEVVALPL